MLNAFKEYLLEKSTIKSQYIPYYLKWISACYNYLDIESTSRLNNDQKKQFLLNMEKRYEDWQVKQADSAIRLHDYFLSRESQ